MNHGNKWFKPSSKARLKSDSKKQGAKWRLVQGKNKALYPAQQTPDLNPATITQSCKAKVSEAEGLEELATSWNYALCSKLDKLAGGSLHEARQERRHSGRGELAPT